MISGRRRLFSVRGRYRYCRTICRGHGRRVLFRVRGSRDGVGDERAAATFSSPAHPFRRGPRPRRLPQLSPVAKKLNAKFRRGRVKSVNCRRPPARHRRTDNTKYIKRDVRAISHAPKTAGPRSFRHCHRRRLLLLDYRAPAVVVVHHLRNREEKRVVFEVLDEPDDRLNVEHAGGGRTGL